jgi:hypothetical protein
MSARDERRRLRRFALVAERAAGCTCTPSVADATIIDGDEIVRAAYVTHAESCRLAVERDNGLAVVPVSLR